MAENILDKGLSESAKNNLLGNADRRMLWQCRLDRRFSYYVYVPESISSADGDPRPVFIFIHGTGRRYETEQYAVYKKFAEQNNCAILFPVFPGGVTDPNDFNDYKLIVSDGFRYDTILLAMVEEMAQRYSNIRTDRFFLAGHSGGGQFVNRFLYLHPDRLFGASIGAPGRPTYLDPERDYYIGIKNWDAVFGQPIDYEALKKVPVQLVVGENDTRFIGEFPYGTTRRERMDALKQNLEQYGLKVEKEIVSGMEHSLSGADAYGLPCNFCAELLKHAELTRHAESIKHA